MLLGRSALTPPLTGTAPPFGDDAVDSRVNRPQLLPMTTFDERLNLFERRLRSLEAELRALRRSAAAENAARLSVSYLSGSDPDLTAADMSGTVTAGPVAVAEQPSLFGSDMAAPDLSGSDPDVSVSDMARGDGAAPRPLDLSFLLSARALAWTGGAVTLLGIVFFFVLSVQRGWIGPSLRVALGGVTAAVVFGAGVWVRRRYGSNYSAYAAVGAGIAGAYATLLAAAALYHLVPAPVALVFAGAIAAVGVATSIAWGSETIAGLGLVGATLVPVVVVFDSGISTLGTAFVALVLAATIIVALRQSWWLLLVAATVTSAPQIEALILDADGRHGFAVALAIAFWLLYGAAGVAGHLRRRTTALPSSFLVFSAAFAVNACAILFGGRTEGTAMLVVAAVYAALALTTFNARRDLAAVAGAITAAVAGVAAADLLNGDTLTVAWAAEAAVLAWLGRRLREMKLQLASLAWLGLAVTHTLMLDAPPTHLFVANDAPARGLIALVAVAPAAAIVARNARGRLRTPLWWIGGAVALYAASLGILGLAEWTNADTRVAFDWGHVGVAVLWALVGGVCVRVRARVAGLAAIAASVALVVVYDVAFVAQTPRALAFLAVALAAFFASFGDDGDTVATMLLAAALALGGAAAVWLLDGTPLALVWAAETAALAGLARRTDIRRVELAAFTWLGVTLAHLLSYDAPLRTFLVPTPQPWHGIPALAGLAAAAASVAWAARDRSLRAISTVVAAAAPVYAASLALLELFQHIGGATPDLAYQRGHTAVSALWGLIGLALLYVGLRRSVRALQLAGFALLGVSVAKLFLYDLAFLSSVARAFSFLAVGGVLLLGGFFYQRLAVDSRR
jgi:uncharacterized membrane protein